MNIPGFSTSGLLMMQDGIKQALALEDNAPDGKDKPYSVRTLSGWKQMSNAIEEEFTKRSVMFEVVLW